MISLTKNLQTEAVIKDMVEKAFGQKKITAITELKEGFFNAAYLIKLSDNSEVVLKIAPPKGASIMTYEKNLMSAEVSSMRLVKEKTTVPVPDILFYSEDDLADRTQESERLCESPYFFMTKLEGYSYNIVKNSMTEQEQYCIEFELGQYNRQMNALSGNYFGYYASASEDSGNWTTMFQKMFRGVLEDGLFLHIDIGIEYEELIKLVREKAYTLESVTAPKLIHWDLWDGNVFVKDGHVEGIIDFERALFGDPLMEYAFRNHNSNKQTGFWEGYGDLKLNAEAQIRRYLYDIYLYLIMIIECDYRKYADNSQYEWAKNMLAEVVKKIQ